MLRRWVSLTPAERRVLRRATIRVASVRFLLSVRPISAVLARVDRGSARPYPDQGVDVATVVWAVKAAGRRMLRRNPCLTEALAVWSLLRQYGFESRIRIGVAREGSQLEAHAWVERDEEVLVGGEESPSNYVPLPVFHAP